MRYFYFFSILTGIGILVFVEVPRRLVPLSQCCGVKMIISPKKYKSEFSLFQRWSLLTASSSLVLFTCRVRRSKNHKFQFHTMGPMAYNVLSMVYEHRIKTRETYRYTDITLTLNSHRTLNNSRFFHSICFE